MGETKKRYDAIDGLKTFSATCIVLMHVLANGNYSLDGFVFDNLIPSFTNLTFLFMVISGFAMSCGYYDKIINSKIPLADFYGNRYTKIWPFFALLCVLDFIISPSVSALYEVFANLTLCFGLLPNVEISVIGVGWFIGLVFVFYLVFPFFCYLISDKRRAWFSFAISLGFNLLCSVYFGIERTNIMYSAVFFMAGGLIFIYREQLEKLSEKHQWITLGFCVIATVGYYVSGENVMMIILMFSMYLIYAIGNTKVSLLQNPVTRFLSNISMEIYLSHMVIYRAIEKLEMTHLFGNGILAYIVTAVGTLVGVIVFATVVKWGIEKLSELLKKRWDRR